MTTGQLPDNRGPALLMVGLALVGLLTIAWGLGREPAPTRDEPVVEQTGKPDKKEKQDKPEKGDEGDKGKPTASGTTYSAVPAVLPGGGTRVFGHDRFLVAYYGTARTGALGVLGETEPDEMHQRVTRAARPFRRDGDQVQVVYELIVTIADRGPGKDGDYSHDIPRAEVEKYVDAAHRNGALLLLDVQPGRSGFLPVARRWAWALQHPWVGLALDPEWRMGPHQVPAVTIGHVDAAEVNRTSAWLDRLTRRADLPEKLFVVHQFRSTMIERIHRVEDRPRLAMVQHADGFGTRRQKLATYDVIARPDQFTMGMKLFYDEDVRRFSAGDVRRIRPAIRFVSYQ